MAKLWAPRILQRAVISYCIASLAAANTGTAPQLRGFLSFNSRNTGRSDFASSTWRVSCRQHDTVQIGSSPRALLCIALNLFLFFYAWLLYHVGTSSLLAGMIVATSLLIGELAALPTQIGIKMVGARAGSTASTNWD